MTAIPWHHSLILPTHFILYNPFDHEKYYNFSVSLLFLCQSFVLWIWFVHSIPENAFVNEPKKGRPFQILQLYTMHNLNKIDFSTEMKKKVVPPKQITIGLFSTLLDKSNGNSNNCSFPCKLHAIFDFEGKNRKKNIMANDFWKSP